MNDQPKQTVLSMAESTMAVIESTNRAEIDMQIATAKKYPRQVQQVIASMKAMISTSPDTAADCYYMLPRGNKRIDGPGIRLAEIAGQNWGNVRIMTRPPIIDNSRVTVEWSAMDLESNYGTTGSVSTNILYGKNHPYKAGQRYDEDMINTICLATIAKARRNATFAIVPGTVIKEMHTLARHIATGGDEPIESKREKAMSYFRKMGIDDERILKAVKCSTIEQLTIEHIADLRGIVTAIRDNTTTIDSAFPPIAGSTPEPSDSAKDFTVKLHASAEQAETPKPKKKPKKEKGKPAPEPEPAPSVAPSPWELLVEKLAMKCSVHNSAAETKLLNFIGLLYKATPDTVTPEQIKDMHSKIDSGDLTVKGD